MKGVNTVRGIFLLAALFFFLPFVTVSCNHEVVAKLSGTDLAFGRTVASGGFYSQPHAVPTENTILLAFLCTLGAAGCTFLKNPELSGRVPTISGAAGAVSLLYFWTQLSSKAAAAGPFEVSCSYGFFLALLSMAGGAALSWRLLWQPPVASKGFATPLGSIPGTPATGGFPPPNFSAGNTIRCGGCSTANPPDNNFCVNCGSPLTR